LKPKPDLTRFYVLRGPTLEAQSDETNRATRVALRIGPGRVADYLRSTPILVSAGPNRIEPLDLHHWAEPLSEGIARTLVENLRQLLPMADVAPHTEPPTGDSGYQLRYQVTRFEGALAQEVVVEARWALNDRHSGRTVLESTFRHTEPLTGSDSSVENYVSHMSRVVAVWSQALAESVATELGNSE
jgi:uncharacterized lipoprotein YmbA